MLRWRPRPHAQRTIAAAALLLVCLGLSPAAAQPARDPYLQRARGLDAESREHLRQGQHAETLMKAQEALALRERALSPANPEVVASLVTVADLLQRSRRPGDARAPLERAVQVLTDAHGPNDPRLVPVLHRLGGSLRGSGDWVGARAVLRRAADIVDRTPPTSAAESRDALGETIPGAALISLAAAFSQAGAQSVVASLWRVNDEATRDFMVIYHGALRAAGRAAALRAAQLALMARPRTAHPYYWAPFILIGAR